MTDLHQKIEEILTKKLSARKIAHTPLGDTDILNADTIASWISPVLHSLCLEYMRGLVPKETSVNEEMWRGVHKQQVDFARGLEGGRVIGFNICRQALLDAIKKEEERDGS